MHYLAIGLSEQWWSISEMSPPEDVVSEASAALRFLLLLAFLGWESSLCFGSQAPSPCKACESLLAMIMTL